MKRGFSIVELMIASSVSIIILLAVGSSFLTVQRMLKTAMAESELSLAGRELRDKMLFRLSPTVSGVCYGGILSGTNAVEELADGRRIVRLQEGGASGNLMLYCPSVKSGLNSQDSRMMRIVMSQNGMSRHLLNEGIPNYDRYTAWLYPSRVGLANDAMPDVVDVSIMQTYGDPLLSLDFTLKSDAKNLDGTPILRRERVTIAPFGMIQPFLYTYQEGAY